MRITPHVTDTGWPAGLERPDLSSTLQTIADDWTGSVKARTAAGRDLDGRQFARRRDGSASTLRDTGQMMRAFGVLDVDDRRFVLGLRDRASRRKAYFAQHGAHGRRRSFLGVSDEAVEDARQTIATARTGKP